MVNVQKMKNVEVGFANVFRLLSKTESAVNVSEILFSLCLLSNCN